MDSPYISQYGWALTPPPGWHCPVSGGTAYDGRPIYAGSPTAVFTFPGDESLDIYWRLSPKKVDRISDLRFAYVVHRDSLNLKQVADLLDHIAPQRGDLQEAHIVTLPDQTRALEAITEFVDENTRQVICVYELVFPDEPPLMVAYKDAVSEYGKTAYVDPVTGEQMWPQALQQWRRDSAGDKSEEYAYLGHPTYQWITFTAQKERFAQWLEAIRSASRSFHYVTRRDPLGRLLKQMPRNLD